MGLKQGPRIFLSVDGQALPATPERVKALTPGRTRARGVFETVWVENGRPFLLENHFSRLARGLKVLGIPGPVTRAQLREQVFSGLAALSSGMARLRIVVWEKAGRTRTAVVVLPYEPYPSARYRRGFRAVWARPRISQAVVNSSVKSLRYQPYQRAYEAARARGYDEALFLNRAGHLVEGARTNLFVVQGGQIWTPALVCGCLAGITRRVVFALAKEAGYGCRAAVLKPEDLFRAEEVFLTSSLIGIMPLREVEGRQVGRGCPGQVTLKIAAAYARLRKARVECAGKPRP